MTGFTVYDSIFGLLKIQYEDSFITKIEKTDDKPDINPTSLTDTVYKQLTEYFEGRRKVFDFPIKLNGTDFQKAVWKELLKIPYGETCSYKEIAEKIENPKACRAVGMANNKNPILIAIPCHRVIGSDGSLVGYGGGLDMKKTLLDLEKQNC